MLKLYYKLNFATETDDTTEEVSTSSDEDSMNDLHDELTSDDYKKL
ncbi:hypothetical protein [Staphylococcus equorum]|nr:hypothetical protein [Staphylococcus equorum]